MSRSFNIRDWYWIVANDGTQVFSSKLGSYVPISNLAYQAWIASGNVPTEIQSEADLWEALTRANVALVPASGASTRKDVQVAGLDTSILAVLFNHENRIRTLSGQQNITIAQFKTAIKSLI